MDTDIASKIRYSVTDFLMLCHVNYYRPHPNTPLIHTYIQQQRMFCLFYSSDLGVVLSQKEKGNHMLFWWFWKLGGVRDSWGILIFPLPMCSLFLESAFYFFLKPSAFCWLCMSPLSAKAEKPLCLSSSQTFQNKGLLPVINFTYLCAQEYLKWLSVTKMQWQSVYSLAGGKYIFPFIVTALLIHLAIYESSTFQH